VNYSLFFFREDDGATPLPKSAGRHAMLSMIKYDVTVANRHAAVTGCVPSSCTAQLKAAQGSSSLRTPMEFCQNEPKFPYIRNNPDFGADRSARGTPLCKIAGQDRFFRNDRSQDPYLLSLAETEPALNDRLKRFALPADLFIPWHASVICEGQI
jgi:hypothetical protein